MKSPFIQIWLASVLCALLWVLNGIFAEAHTSNETAISVLYLLLLLYPFYVSCLRKPEGRWIVIGFIIIVYSVAFFSIVRNLTIKPCSSQDNSASPIETNIFREYPIVPEKLEP